MPFFTTKPDGSGIGLSLARRIAQKHDGRIILFNREPHGSVFRLDLPPAADNPDPCPRPTSPIIHSKPSNPLPESTP